MSFSVPAVIAGVASASFGLLDIATAFSGTVAVLDLSAAARDPRFDQGDATHRTRDLIEGFALTSRRPPKRQTPSASMNRQTQQPPQ